MNQNKSKNETTNNLPEPPLKVCFIETSFIINDLAKYGRGLANKILV